MELKKLAELLNNITKAMRFEKHITISSLDESYGDIDWLFGNVEYNDMKGIDVRNLFKHEIHNNKQHKRLIRLLQRERYEEYRHDVYSWLIRKTYRRMM